MKKTIIIAALMLAAAAYAQENPPNEPVDPVDPAEPISICHVGFLDISTGVNHNAGTLYPEFAKDNYWSITHMPQNSEVNECAYVISEAEFWTGQQYWNGNMPNSTASNWISPYPTNHFTQTNLDPGCVPDAGPVRFTRTFRVLGTGNANLRITFRYVCDGFLDKVLVDGVQQYAPLNSFCPNFSEGQLMGGGGPGAPPGIYVQLAPGLHTISFDIMNFGGDHLGFRLEGSIVAYSTTIYNLAPRLEANSAECYQGNHCLQEIAPPCPDNFGSLSANFMGRDNHDCNFVATATSGSSGIYLPAHYSWFIDNTYIQTNYSGTTDILNTVVPNGDDQVLMVKIFYTDGRLRSCISYHSVILNCPLDGDPQRITSMAENGNRSLFAVYPNPSSGIFNLGTRAEKVTVYNVIGQIVLTAKEVNAIDAAPLPSGTYLLKVERDARTENFTIVKE